MQIMKREQSFFPPATSLGHYALENNPVNTKKATRTTLNKHRNHALINCCAFESTEIFLFGFSERSGDNFVTNGLVILCQMAF